MRLISSPSGLHTACAAETTGRALSAGLMSALRRLQDSTAPYGADLGYLRSRAFVACDAGRRLNSLTEMPPPIPPARNGWIGLIMSKSNSIFRMGIEKAEELIRNWK